MPQVVAQIPKDVVTHITNDIFSVPWGHHRYIIDKYKNIPEKALFYVHQTVLNGWSRNVLLNFLDTDLYERQGKAIANFSRTLPDETSSWMRSSHLRWKRKSPTERVSSTMRMSGSVTVAMAKAMRATMPLE